jgi:hypothetical protein
MTYGDSMILFTLSTPSYSDLKDRLLYPQSRFSASSVSNGNPLTLGFPKFGVFDGAFELALLTELIAARRDHPTRGCSATSSSSMSSSTRRLKNAARLI